MNKIYTEIYATQLLKQRIYGIEQTLTVLCVGNNGVYHLVMTVNDRLELVAVAVVACKGKARSLNKLVCDSTQCTNNNNNWLFFCLLLYNLLQAENTLYGTNTGSAKFYYFHKSCVQLLRCTVVVLMIKFPHYDWGRT